MNQLSWKGSNDRSQLIGRDWFALEIALETIPLRNALKTQKCSARTFELVAQVKPSSWIRYLWGLKWNGVIGLTRHRAARKQHWTFGAKIMEIGAHHRRCLNGKRSERRTSVDAISRLQVGQKSWAFAFQLEGRFTTCLTNSKLTSSL